MRTVALTTGGRLDATLVAQQIDALEAAAEQTVGDLGLKGYNLMANLMGFIQEPPDPWT
jgi:hypothetical protein